MRKTSLTRYEKNETVWITIGRLRAALENTGNTSLERSIAIFEKIVSDIENDRLGVVRNGKRLPF